ncbi:MAG: SGNH/GDSL hydrolase family protein, partial [Hyphomicrobium sp.]
MKRAFVTAILSVLAGALASVASAQDGGFRGSFITPFPANDVYQVQVMGDWLAEGLLNGMLEPTASGARVNIQRRRWDLAGLMRRGTMRDLADIESRFASERPHIIIVMLGVRDRFSLSSKRLRSRNDEWRKMYAERVDRLIKALKQGNRAVYWVGLPNMRRWRDNERARLMNDIIRERAYLNGVRFIDAYASFVDEAGGYSPYGPDITGRIRRLRDSDGVYFTYAGNRKLAHFVQRELKRDLAQARRDRAIPLAGSQAEQARINPNR